ncbi:MAG: hypothetical protein ABEK50_00205 [bacterium]
MNERSSSPLARWFIGGLLVLGGGLVGAGFLMRLPLGNPAGNAVFFSQFLFWIGSTTGAFMLIGALRLVRAEWRRAWTRPAELLGAVGLVICLFWPVLLSRRTAFLNRIDISPHAFWPAFVPEWGLWVEGIAVMGVLGMGLYVLFQSMVLEREWLPSWIEGSSEKLTEVLKHIESEDHDHTDPRSKLKRSTVLFLIVLSITLTLLGWGYGMNLVPGWSPTIFGAYYLATSIQAGAALLLIAGLTFRVVFGLEDIVTKHHVDQLGKLMVALALFWFYFRFAEFLTVWYGEIPEEIHVFTSQTVGVYPFLFWFQVGANFLVPLVYFSFPRLRRCLSGVFVLSLAILAGSSMERWMMFGAVHINGQSVLIGSGVSAGWITSLVFPGVLLIVIGLALLMVPPVARWEWEDGEWMRGRRTVGQDIKATYSLLDPEEVPRD